MEHVANGSKEWRMLTSQDARLDSPETPDGYFLISASKDGQPMLRNGTTGDWIGTFEGHKGAVWSACLNSTATLAATGSADFTAGVWDAITGDQMHEFEHKHIVRTVDFSRNGNMLLTGGYEKCVRLYDITAPEVEPNVIEGFATPVHCALFVNNDTTVLAANNDAAGVGVFDLRTLTRVRTLPTDLPVMDMELSHDGKFLTTCDGNVVRFWDACTLTLVKSVTCDTEVESASLCLERGKFVVGGVDMWVHLYDYNTGKEIECNKGHHGPVHTVRFAPTGDLFSSGSEDGTIRIWETDPSAPVPASDQEGVEGSQSVDTKGLAIAAN
mmetsp:Transcript_3500/g.21992  ORF Transcript_3500/g.21992 Transcript_3500/m.21992 type:complete len:327 (-) Transcript_3500:967-1947(-)